MQLYRPKITFFETNEQMRENTYTYVLDCILDSSAREGIVRIALAGGSTPMHLYKKLGLSPEISWEQVELYQTDERFVDSKNALSNQFQITNSFTEETLNRCKGAYFFDTSLPLEQSIQAYEEILDSNEGNLFDLVILGIGKDGHIASLFPGGNYLKHLEEKVIATNAPVDYDVNQRLSLTIETILNSATILVVLEGSDKEHIVQQIMEGEQTVTQFPAKFLLTHPSVHIFQSLEGISTPD